MNASARRPLGPRGAAGLLATAVLLTGGLAGTAQAEDEAPLTLPITASKTHVDVDLADHAEGMQGPEATIGFKGPGEEPEPDEEGVIYPVRYADFKVTVDASDLEGVASVDLSGLHNCDVEDMVAVCSGWEVYAGEYYNELGSIQFNANSRSASGDTGTVRITGEGENLTFTPQSIDVLVGGATYKGRTLTEPKGFAAGDTLKAPLGFRNAGGQDGKGAVLKVHGSYGLLFEQRYRNCTYTETTTGSLLHQGTDVVCVFPGTFEAGAAYELSAPMEIATHDYAAFDIVHYRFSTGTASGTGKPGDGPELTLREVPGADAGDYATYTELDFPTNTPIDLELTGASVKGGKGDTVTAELGFRNNGPAWISSLRSGGEPIRFTVGTPEGTTVTKAPANCRQANVEDRREYLCSVATPMLPDAAYDLPFELRVDKVVAGAKGKAALPDGGRPDSDPSNDTAWIVVNGDQDTTPGEDDEPTPGPGDGEDDGQDGDGGAKDGEQDGDTGGGLASTGAGNALLIGGGALLLTALGAGLYLIRRRAAGTTAV
ncbi:hypothetical protein [Streptomyces abyssomicinicus]|uniref:hypothetical protein n=1 Tax=Streptomyces abyssomicinicus TaxID=574929 RepID=UPI0012503C76|nr:hypothetical protein [Streptomyces abyssomicinicus]